jgi:hypothetical protein
MILDQFNSYMLRSAIITDSLSLAKLHSETLTASFLAGLGLNFLVKLYEFLINKEKVWVYEEDNEVKGFVSFPGNSAGMMKHLLPPCWNTYRQINQGFLVRATNIDKHEL